MKSILTAIFLLTMSFGNVIDIIVIEMNLHDKALEFFIFAGLMAVVSTIFAIQAHFYKYVDSVYRSDTLEMVSKSD